MNSGSTVFERSIKRMVVMYPSNSSRRKHRETVADAISNGLTEVVLHGNDAPWPVEYCDELNSGKWKADCDFCRFAKEFWESSIGGPQSTEGRKLAAFILSSHPMVQKYAKSGISALMKNHIERESSLVRFRGWGFTAR